MEPRERILLAWSKLEEATYYDLLSVEPGVSRSGLQRAFHRFALAYHPDRHVDEDDEVQEKARMVFQRGVEAYSVLRDARMAAAYQAALAAGSRRLTPEQLEQLSRPEPAPPRAKAAPPGFVGQMRTPDGREVAARFERLFAEGRYAEAYQQLGLLEQVEPDNDAVRARLVHLSRMVKARH